MGIDAGILLSILLFAIIYCAVRLAIEPLVKKQEEVTTDKQDLGLVKLRDIEVLSNTELEEVIALYQNKGSKKKEYEQYEKYKRVLNELIEIGYLSDEQYSIKISKLKKYYKVD
jgi:hypothetical protein